MEEFIFGEKIVGFGRATLKRSVGLNVCAMVAIGPHAKWSPRDAPLIDAEAM
jgi:hypothetical protein